MTMSNCSGLFFLLLLLLLLVSVLVLVLGVLLSFPLLLFLSLS